MNFLLLKCIPQQNYEIKFKMWLTNHYLSDDACHAGHHGQKNKAKDGSLQHPLHPFQSLLYIFTLSNYSLNNNRALEHPLHPLQYLLYIFTLFNYSLNKNRFLQHPLHPFQYLLYIFTLSNYSHKQE